MKVVIMNREVDVVIARRHAQVISGSWHEHPACGREHVLCPREQRLVSYPLMSFQQYLVQFLAMPKPSLHSSFKPPVT
jgi:hypothetical protein